MWEYKFVPFRFFKVCPFILSLAVGVQWSLNEVIFGRSNPSWKQKIKMGGGCLGCLLCWWAAFTWPWTLEHPALIPLCVGGHLSVTPWPFLINSCLVVKAQSIFANLLNLYQASPLIPEYTEQSEKIKGSCPALSHLQEAEKGIHLLNSQPGWLVHSSPLCLHSGHVLLCP